MPSPTYALDSTVRILVSAVLAVIPPSLIGTLVWQGRRRRPPSISSVRAPERTGSRRNPARAFRAGSHRREGQGEGRAVRRKGTFRLHRRRCTHFHRAPLPQVGRRRVGHARGQRSRVRCLRHGHARECARPSSTRKSVNAKLAGRLARGHRRPDVLRVPPRPLLRQVDGLRCQGRGCPCRWRRAARRRR